MLPLWPPQHALHSTPSFCLCLRVVCSHVFGKPMSAQLSSDPKHHAGGSCSPAQQDSIQQILAHWPMLCQLDAAQHRKVLDVPHLFCSGLCGKQIRRSKGRRAYPIGTQVYCFCNPISDSALVKPEDNTSYKSSSVATKCANGVLKQSSSQSLLHLRMQQRQKLQMQATHAHASSMISPHHALHWCILAEGAIALPVTLSGGVLFAS